MPITLGNTSISGLAAGGLPNGTITTGLLADSGRMTVAVAQRNSQQSLGGDSGWNDHLSLSFTTSVTHTILIQYNSGISFESGPAQGFNRILLNGNKIGVNVCTGKQSTANSAGGASICWSASVGPGTHTVMIQARNSAGGSTWITPYWSVDGEGANTLAVWYYQ